MNPRPGLVNHGGEHEDSSLRHFHPPPGWLKPCKSRLGGSERSDATLIERPLRFAIDDGIFITMNPGTQTTIDATGRLVIPKSLRVAAGLVPGMPLTITFREGRIEIEPAPLEVELVDRGGFTVAEPVTPVEALSHSTVRDTKDQIRTGRKRR